MKRTWQGEDNFPSKKIRKNLKRQRDDDEEELFPFQKRANQLSTSPFNNKRPQEEGLMQGEHIHHFAPTTDDLTERLNVYLRYMQFNLFLQEIRIENAILHSQLDMMYVY